MLFSPCRRSLWFYSVLVVLEISALFLWSFSYLNSYTDNYKCWVIKGDCMLLNRAIVLLLPLESMAIQDLNWLGNSFIITSRNNGKLYVMLLNRAIVFRVYMLELYRLLMSMVGYLYIYRFIGWVFFSWFHHGAFLRNFQEQMLLI